MGNSMGRLRQRRPRTSTLEDLLPLIQPIQHNGTNVLPESKKITQDIGFTTKLKLNV